MICEVAGGGWAGSSAHAVTPTSSPGARLAWKVPANHRSSRSPSPARPPGGTAHRGTRPRRAGSRPGDPVRLLEPETAVDPLHPRWPVTVALAMAIAPGVQRRDLHPDGPRGPHHTVHHRHRRAVPVHGQLPVHDDVAHRPAPAGNPVFDHERLQVDKAVGVDRPSRSFVDRQAYPAAPELNRRAGRDAQHDPLPGLERLDCDAVVMASRDIVPGMRPAAATAWPQRSGGPPRRVRRPSCPSRCGAPATPSPIRRC
jgi:hypothetical protein